MLLGNLKLLSDDDLHDVQIERGRIQSILPAGKSPILFSDSLRIRFEKALIFPGLINSHDHLDFNLFPRLGNRLYKNYREWGLEINKENKNLIGAILKIPQELRIQWGIYKNLLNGITTVVNHGERLKTGKELITVYQEYKSLHSVGFEKNWIFKLNQPFKNRGPFVIHVGEGRDENSHKEIDRLIKYNFFWKDLIGIHGVAMDEIQASAFRGLVWCPDSNFFLLGKTASIDRLQFHTKLGFGTDSCLTSSWNFWDQLRMARKTGMVSDDRLFAMLTTEAAEVWGLDASGKIAVDHHADLVIVENKQSLVRFDSFYNLSPEDILMVIHKGMIRLFDESLQIQLKSFDFPFHEFTKVQIKKRNKYIEGDFPGLINRIREIHGQFNFPEDLCLA
jgi:cytosine/adenosine deaminase-related metal-dependent hydrolase